MIGDALCLKGTGANALHTARQLYHYHHEHQVVNKRSAVKIMEQQGKSAQGPEDAGTCIVSRNPYALLSLGSYLLSLAILYPLFFASLFLSVAPPPIPPFVLAPAVSRLETSFCGPASFQLLLPAHRSPLLSNYIWIWFSSRPNFGKFDFQFNY